MKVTFEGIEYTLLQDAYYAGAGQYKALATDKYGNRYYIYWDILTPDAEEECDLCDWVEPVAVERI